MSVAFELEGVVADRGTSRVLDDLTLRVDEGEVKALLGPSGSGKSTVIRLLLGLLAPVRGTVRIREELASRGGEIRVPPEERDLAVVFQDLALWPHLTVAGNLRFVLRSRRAPRDQEEQRIEEVLSRVGLSDKRDRHPGELSGGEQQRVAIARALVTRPTAVLLDEPLTNLDLALRMEILDLLGALLRDGRTAALYVTHDPREAVRLSRCLAILDGGRIVQEGTPQELRRSPATPFAERILGGLEAPGEPR